QPGQGGDVDRGRVQGGHAVQSALHNPYCTSKVVLMSDEVPAVIRALYSGLESGAHGEALRGLFTAGASSVEHPNAFNPAGSRRSLDEMLAASTAGAGLLREQRYDVRSCIVAGDLAILRVRWTGIVAREVGPLRPGR